MNTSNQKITPFLWFDKQAEEAMNFYAGLFNDARIVTINRYPEGFEEGPMAGMGGKVLTAVNDYIALVENAAISHLTHFEAGEPGIEGTVKQAAFSLHSQPFMAMDGGPARGALEHEGIITNKLAQSELK